MRAEALKYVREGAALTPREKSVLDLLVKGFTNAEIGHFLGISKVTVQNHACVLLRKKGASSRVELAVMSATESRDQRISELESLLAQTQAALEQAARRRAA